MKRMSSSWWAVISSRSSFTRSSNSPVLRPRDEGVHVELHQALPPEDLGDLVPGDPLGQALDDRRLPHPRFSNEDGVVLLPPGEDLDHGLDLLGPADDRVELPLAGKGGEVPGVLVEDRSRGLLRPPPPGSGPAGAGGPGSPG